MKCKRCEVEMILGKALVDILSGIPDFIGDDFICTVSPSGEAKLVDCLKCPNCGHSVTTTKINDKDKEIEKLRNQIIFLKNQERKQNGS